MTEQQKVAELLHKNFCKRDHTECCDWHYRNWKVLGDRKPWLDKAAKLLRRTNAATVASIIDKYKALEKEVI